jgi:hypothetical protein
MLVATLMAIKTAVTKIGPMAAKKMQSHIADPIRAEQAHQATRLMRASRLMAFKVQALVWLGIASLGLSIVALVLSLLAFLR